jgi:hypothetical protein
MADVVPRDVPHDPAAHAVTLLQQIRLVAGLRWRLTRNKMRLKNNRLDLIGVIFAGVLGALLVLGLSAVFFGATREFISRGQVSWMALLFWGIFIWWQILPFFVAGFGANFEFRTLLRFPLDRRAFYLIGLAYGLADFSSLAACCWLLAMTAGVAVADSGLLLMMMLVCGMFLLLNVTLERVAGSWLERILAGRRTRELFFALFILAMLSLQLLTPLLGRYGHDSSPGAHKWLSYLAPFPGSLAGRAVAETASGNLSGAFTALGGLFVYIVIFSCMLWLRFAAQYRGEELSEALAPVRRVAPRAAAGESNDALSFLPVRLAEMLRKEFRYLLRNGFSFVLLILPPLMILIFTMPVASQGHHGPATDLSRSAFFPGMMGYLILVLMGPAYNCFAYEGRGIQTYFMSPIRFREVFLGKNLMMAAILILEMGVSIVVFSFRVGLPDTPIVVATLAAIVFTVAGQFAIANWSSLSFPRKLNFGQMRGQRQSGMAVLVVLGAQIIFGGVSALLFLAGRWTGNAWLPTEGFVFLAAAAIAGYVAALEPLSNYAEQKKESLIEALCR